jgi:DNA adenine methylase
MPFYTPLRYPGGKRKLIVFFKVLFEENRLVGCCYAEPFAGGAGLALQLLFENYASHILLNDLNVSIFSFWNSVLNHTEDLCRLIQETSVTLEEWNRQKAVQAHAENLCGSIELGFSTFFLNRTNRSGILNGGVIGGKKQDGVWKLDARFQKKDLIQRIQSIASRRQQITLSKMDAVEFIKQYGEKHNALFPYFFYMDPPYYKKGAGLYDNFFQPKDHIELANCIKETKYPWVVSYDNVPDVRKLYKNYRALTYSLNYTAQEKNIGLEFMAFSDVLLFPKAIYNSKRSLGCMRQITALM